MASTEQTNSEVGHDGGHDNGVFPPFDPSTFGGQLLWLAIVFGALYLLMSRVGLPRVEAILAARKAAHEGDLAEAARLRAETEDAIAAFDKALAEAHAHAEEIGRSTKDRLNAEIGEKRKALDAELTANLDAEEHTITANKAKAMHNVGEIATESTIAIVQHLIGQAPSAAEASAAVSHVVNA
jgi:F-type H+-transporting ATPase subunit b